MDTILLDLEFFSQMGAEVHIHNDLEMIYVIKGEARVEIADQTWNMASQDYILVNANTRHAFDVGQDSLVGIFHLPFLMISNCVGSDRFIITINSADGDIAHNNEEISSIIHEIFNSGVDQKSVFSNFRLYYRLLEILTSAYLQVDAGEHPDDDNNHDNRLLEITDYINRYYYQNISLNDLAARLFLSPSYLSKYFKKHFGANFLQYINEIRLTHALSDIKYTDKAITKIALEVGFTNLRTFNKLFLSKYNQSPVAYRKAFLRNLDTVALPDRHLPPPADVPARAPMRTDYQDIINKEIRIPASPQDKLDPFWQEIINIGTAEELLLSDVQKHVLKLREKLHFRYVRFWSLFTRSMYLNYHEVGKTYNFNRLDRVLDFLISNQIKPMIDIANKNKVLSRSSHDKRKIAPSETNLFYRNELIEYFFSELATHLVSRYGRAEVESWLFEFWMEENEKSFDKRIVFDEDILNHVQLFSVVSGSLRRIIPDIRLGTGGFSIRYDRHCTSNIIHALENLDRKPDFLTFYAFPLAKPAETPIQQNQVISPDFLKERLTLISKVIGKSRLKDVPLIVSEWNLTAYNRNAINDSVFKGAYIIKNIIDCIGIVDSLGYWLGSDLYGDFIEDSDLIIGASGLLSKDGIFKPAWHAFSFMNALGRDILSKGSYHLATTDGQESWTIICHNLKTLNHYYLVLPEEKVDSDEFPKMMIDSKPLQLSFKLDVPADGSFRVKTHTINHRFGSVQDEWSRMNRPAQLDREDIDYLMDICVPDIKIQNVSSKQGQLQIGTQLEANAFQLIQILRRDGIKTD